MLLMSCLLDGLDVVGLAGHGEGAGDLCGAAPVHDTVVAHQVAHHAERVVHRPLRLLNDHLWDRRKYYFWDFNWYFSEYIDIRHNQYFQLSFVLTALQYSVRANTLNFLKPQSNFLYIHNQDGSKEENHFSWLGFVLWISFQWIPLRPSKNGLIYDYKYNINVP